MIYLYTGKLDLISVNNLVNFKPPRINALVFSKLCQCSSVWYNSSVSHMQKLQLVQNCAARIISGAKKFELITRSLKNLGQLPLKKQVCIRDAIFAFKRMTGCAPTYLTSQFATRRQISDRITRHSQQLNIPLFKTTPLSGVFNKVKAKPVLGASKTRL